MHRKFETDLNIKTRIGFGGGCHWCTEAVFQSLKGVDRVEQGYVASEGAKGSFSEAVIVHFTSDVISLQTLIQIHLHTHNSTSQHSMRVKYRSAIYTFSEKQKTEAYLILTKLQLEFENSLITEVLPFSEFKASREQLTDYYYKNPQKPFCKSFIDPKLKLLIKRFSEEIDTNKVAHLVETV